MIFSEVGQPVPGFHVLGNRQIPCYLMNGPRPVLFDSGISALADRYVEEARRALAGREPAFLLLTHAHFDHCGSASEFRKAFPGLRIAASAQTAEILRRPRALELIGALNEEAKRRAPLLGIQLSNPAPFRPFDVDVILSDGDELDLGQGETVRVLATPGHTRDFLSYYVPGRRILVASEAAGCANRAGEITPEFVADYDAYLASLRRLSQLDVEVLCQGHVHVYTGEDARGFFARSILATERYREWVEELLEAEGGDLERVVARVKAEEYDSAPQPKQPEPAYLLNTQARVRILAARRAAQQALQSQRPPPAGNRPNA